MAAPIEDSALDQIFRQARTFGKFTSEPVSDETIAALYALLKWGPTAFNSQPARYVFVRSAEAKARLAPALSAGNRDKTIAAPATVIIAYDTQFYEHLPEQFPVMDARKIYLEMPALVEPTAFRNGTLQGAYLILAARALGLDVGPMSGFDAKQIDQEFFPNGRFKSNFIANLGIGDPSTLHPRGPRLPFETAVQIL